MSVLGGIIAAYSLAGVTSLSLSELVLLITWAIFIIEVYCSRWILHAKRYRQSLALFLALFSGIGTVYIARDIASKKSLQELPASNSYSQDAASSPKPTAPAPNSSLSPTSGPSLEFGVILGADQRIGIDSIADCSKPSYRCLTESEIRRKGPLAFDVGQKGWARIIFTIKNRGDVKLAHPVSHIESPDAVSIEYAPRPDPTRMPRNVLDIFDGFDIYPVFIADGGADLPVDITVSSRIESFSLNIKTFGDNMKAHQLHLVFQVEH